MKYMLEKPYGADSLVEVIALRAFAAFNTSKLLRSSSRHLPQITVIVTILLFGAYLWSSHLVGRSLSPEYEKVLNWKDGEIENKDTGGGLRIVVFGGGDIATPSRASWQVGGPNTSWTEILCRQLSCNTYLPFTPLADNDEGAIVSNSLFEAALLRTSPTDNSTLSGLDYSWISENYPVPPYPDLLRQIDDFLASPPPQHPPRETLWVLNMGFWDVWHLAALPRKLATHLIETQTEHLFSRLEVIYEEAHKNDSIAFSDYYADMDLSAVHTTAEDPLPRAPFRVLIPKPFDISLTPGFESARFAPPHPHSKTEQMRNAAFLTHHWDKVVQDMLSKWVRIPDLEEANTEEDELSKIKDADLLLSKKSVKENGLAIPCAQREAITYDISGYIQEVMVERQLRQAGLVDHNGLGSTMTAEGYSEVWEPCVKPTGPNYDNNNGTRNDTESSISWSVCDAPDEHLFWTGFTVSRQAIFEIGDRVAKLIKRHAQQDAEWIERSQQSLSSVRKGPDGTALRFDILDE